MVKLNQPDVGAREARYVKRVLKSGTLTQGPVTDLFEKNFAEYLGQPNALAVTSATTGLQLALWAAGVGPGDEVIVPDYSWPATANSVIAVGATPVFADIRLKDFGIDVESVRSLITEKTKAVIPVHAFGIICDIVGIVELASQHNLAVIEDAACAIGSKLDGKAAGTFGDFGVFSFHPRKVITTGEGGMVVVQSDGQAGLARVARTHGATRRGLYMSFEFAGFNYRMSEIQAAVGLAQLERIETILAKRRKVAKKMEAFLESVDEITLFSDGGSAVFNYQTFAVLLGEKVNRDEVVVGLREQGIEATLGTYSMLAHKAFEDFRPRFSSEWRNSQTAYSKTLSLPCHGAMAGRDIRKVCNALKAVIFKKS